MNDRSRARFTPVAQTAPIARPNDGSTLPGPQPSEADSEIDLMKIFVTLWHGKWLIGICTFFAALLGLYYAFELAVPKYTARASLAIQAQDQQIVDLESVMSGVSTELSSMNTELEVLRSRGLLERLVTEMNLVADPEFNARLREPSPFSARAIRSVLSGFLPVSPPVPLMQLTDDELKIRVTDSVRRAISVSSKRDTYLINISVTTGSRNKSTEIANKLAQLYLDDQIAVKFSATEFAVNWLSGRVTELETELKSKEDAIKNLRADTELVSVEALETLSTRSKSLRDRLSDAQNEVASTQEKLQLYETLAAGQDIVLIEAAALDQQLSQLSRRAVNGDVAAQQAFFARFDNLLSLERLNAQRAASQKEALQQSYDRLLAEIEVQNTDLVKLNQLVREADATRVLYETFLARLKETSIQIGLHQADGRILSRATPPRKPVEPRTNMILAFSFLLGTMVGVGIVTARQLLHNVFQTTDQLERYTGYSVLGEIPTMPLRRREGLLQYLKTQPTSAAAEAIRNLRTSILMSQIDSQPKVIMSTSSVPCEGKTTNAIALAHNFAGMDKSVLLIEGDIRRRALNAYFQQTPPGTLIKVISGEQTLADAVLHDDVLGIDVLMGDRTSINAADLFSSEKFRDMIEAARRSYDVVIIDTPPVLVVPDARVIGHLADTIVYFVLWDQTAKPFVVDGLRQFSSIGLRVGGLVLSKVDTKRMKKYGYGGRYGSYGQGYYDV